MAVLGKNDWGQAVNENRNKPLVSVVLPMYNVERYVEDVIRSIHGQTYKKIELVLVDDGSPDQSAKVAREVADELGMSYVLVSQENKGVSAARNAGISKATGMFVICVDPDDVLAPKCIEQLVRGSLESCVPVFAAPYSYICDDDLPYVPDDSNQFEILSQNEALLSHLLRDRKIVAPALLIRNDVAKNIRYKETVRFAEDVLYVWDVLRSVESFGYLKYPGYGYRLRPNSTMTAPNLEKSMTGIVEFEKLSLAMEGCFPEPKWVAERWLLGLLHVFAGAGDWESFSYVYKEHYRANATCLLSFPEMRTRLIAIWSLLGPRPLYHVLKRR